MMRIGKKQTEQSKKSHQGEYNSLTSLLLKCEESEFLVGEALNIMVDIIGDVDLTVIKIVGGSVRLVDTTIPNEDNRELLLSMIDYYLASNTGSISKSIQIKQRPSVLRTRVVPLQCGNALTAYLLIDEFEEDTVDIEKYEEIFDTFSMIVRLCVIESELKDAYEKDALTKLKTRDSLTDLIDSIIGAGDLDYAQSFHLGLVHLINAKELNESGSGGYERVDTYLKDIASKLLKSNKDKVYRLCGATFAFLMHKNRQDACKQAVKVLDDIMEMSEEIKVSVVIGKILSTGIKTIYNCESHLEEAKHGDIVVYGVDSTPEEEEEFALQKEVLTAVLSNDIHVIEPKSYEAGKRDKKEKEEDVEYYEGEIVSNTDIEREEFEENERLKRESRGQTTFHFQDDKSEDTYNDSEVMGFDFDMDGEGLCFDDDEDTEPITLDDGSEDDKSALKKEQKKEQKNLGEKTLDFIRKMNSPFG